MKKIEIKIIQIVLISILFEFAYKVKFWNFPPKTPYKNIHAWLVFHHKSFLFPSAQSRTASCIARSLYKSYKYRICVCFSLLTLIRIMALMTQEIGGHGITSSTCPYWQIRRCNRDPFMFLHRTAPPPTSTCKYWMNGNCKFGDQCRSLHSWSDVEATFVGMQHVFLVCFSFFCFAITKYSRAKQIQRF